MSTKLDELGQRVGLEEVELGVISSWVFATEKRRTRAVEVRMRSIGNRAAGAHDGTTTPAGTRRYLAQRNILTEKITLQS